MSQGSRDSDGLVARQAATTALFGGNATYVEDLYERYLAGEDVPADWKAYFDGLKPQGAVERVHGPIVRDLTERAAAPRAVVVHGDAVNEKQAAVARLIQVYSNRGHLIANLDPLGLMKRAKPRVLELEYMGLTPADFDTEFFTGSRTDAIPRRATLREIVQLMEFLYTGPIGAEFAQVSDTEERLWLQDEFQRGRMQQGLSAQDRKDILWQLTAAEGLECSVAARPRSRSSSSAWRIVAG
jgi:2-oxoglutarate dehydrogenase E1 component